MRNPILHSTLVLSFVFLLLLIFRLDLENLSIQNNKNTYLGLLLAAMLLYNSIKAWIRMRRNRPLI